MAVVGARAHEVRERGLERERAAEIRGVAQREQRVHVAPARDDRAVRTPGNSDFENDSSCTTSPSSSRPASDGTGRPA